MTVPAGMLVTYEDGNRLEDVMAMVIMISPTEKPFTTGIGKTKAYNTQHQWPEDALAARGLQALVEGDVVTFGSVTAPSRVYNYTQIFEKPWQLSSTMLWQKSAGIDNQEAYYRGKALEELGGDIELSALTGTLSAGDGTAAARLMGGAIHFITTLTTDVTAGTVNLGETAFNDACEASWGQGGKIDEVYCNAKLKRTISGFTAGATKNVSSEDKRLTNAVDVYESDFSVVKIFKTRDLGNTDGAANILFIENKGFKLAIGEPVHEVPKSELANTIRGISGVYRGELTLECRAQAHNVYQTGYLA